jgi:membrane-bound lytic murein transglycosylase B
VPLAPPAPAAPIPAASAALVASWRDNERALDTAIDKWNTTRPPTREVTLRALYEQRVVRALSAEPKRARIVLRLAPSLRDDVAARVDLRRLAAKGPRTPGNVRLGGAPPAARLVQWYRAAQQRFHVRWQLLAAVNFVESAFNRVRNRSGAGAQGPMQFVPATWRAYGLGGDVHDPHDAILGAANYLAANGGAHDERTALYHYNPSRLYVDAILRYTRRMAHDRRAFYRYYSWQVYFRDRRVTGPR